MRRTGILDRRRCNPASRMASTGQTIKERGIMMFEEGSRWFPPGQDWLALADGRVMRGGHLPGALHLHASTTLNASDWTFRDKAAIQELARTAGIEPAHRVITYCGVG